MLWMLWSVVKGRILIWIRFNSCRPTHLKKLRHTHLNFNNAKNARTLLKYTNACQIDADPDQAYHFDEDPDPLPAYHFDADPDPNFQFDADPATAPQH
jgi:hypothetical protein